jgi:soluble cytochrome b562
LEISKVIDFAVALASKTKGWEALKAIQEIEKNLDAATYKAKVAELMSAVADAKIALVDAREEVASKNKEIGRLKEGLRCPHS